MIDLDIRKFFDSVRWDLVVKAVEAHTDARWVVLYVKRWLAAPVQLPDGSLRERDRGTPQGSVHKKYRTWKKATRSMADAVKRQPRYFAYWAWAKPATR